MQQTQHPPTTVKRPRTSSHSRSKQPLPNIDTPADLLPFPAPVDFMNDNSHDPVVSYHAGGGFVSQPGQLSNQQNMQYNLNQQQQVHGRPLGVSSSLHDNEAASVNESTAIADGYSYQSGLPRLDYSATKQQARPPNRVTMVEQAGGPGFMFNTGGAAPSAGTASQGRSNASSFSPADSSSPPASSSFHHVEDLDRFFVRVYRYHQRGGFWCMVLQELLEIVQFVFVVCFSVFLLRCVNYPVLFRDKPPPAWWSSTFPAANSSSSIPASLPNNRTAAAEKLRLSDALLPATVCLSHMPFLLVVTIIIAVCYLMFRLFRFCAHLVEHAHTQLFYQHALGIASDADLQDYTWYEVLQKMLHAQRHHQMSVHKADLTELDVYQRILRKENYVIALLNKAVVPMEINVPFALPFSSTTQQSPPLPLLSFMYVPRLYELNLEWLLFRGYAAPFVDRCSLREEYKQASERARMVERMRERITWLAVGSFVLSPILFVWQCLYIVFNYGELLKRDPGALGSRTWSSYGKWYVRHFNELEHELRARLNRAYRPANEYMSIFVNPLVTTIAHNLVFFAGSMLVVLVGLTVWDEDVITVEHVITLITGLGVIVAIGRAMLPDENLVWNPQQLMTSILAQIHYMPDGWTEQAHKTAVRDQVANLFQFKLVFLLQELWSPFLTPFVLFFALRKRAPAIVDFLRDYTDEVVGVGDVCSFALMDVRRHGKREWMPATADDDNKTFVNARTPMEATRLGLSTHEQLEREIYAGGVTTTAAAVGDAAEDERLLDSDNVGKSNFGKTELSLIHFKLLNPKWRPTTKHNQRYLELVLRTCLQNPNEAYDQAPALRLSALAAQQLDASQPNYSHAAAAANYHQSLFNQSIYGGVGLNSRSSHHDLMRDSQIAAAHHNNAGIFKGQLQRFEGAPAHELAQCISSSNGGGGRAGNASTSEQSTSSSGMSDMSNSALPNNAALFANSMNNSAYAGEPLLRSMMSGNGGLPLDLTAHAMSTSILQVHGAHLRRTRSSHQQQTAAAAAAQQTHDRIYDESSAFARSAASDVRFLPAQGSVDKMMTKAQLSVVPCADNSNNANPQQIISEADLNSSTSANAGSIYPWAQSFRRWFPMRIIAGPVGGHQVGAGERAPLVTDDYTARTPTGASVAERRWPPGHDDNLV